MKYLERLEAAYNLEIPDHVPVSFAGFDAPWFTSYFRVSFREYYFNPKTMLKCQLIARKRFGNRTGVWPDFPSWVVMANALGAPYRVYDDVPLQQAGPVIKSIEEVDDFEFPEPEDALKAELPSTVSRYQKLFSKVQAHIRAEEGAFGYYGVGFFDPFDLFCILRKVGSAYFIQPLRDMIHNPDLVHKLLRKCMEWDIKFMEYLEGRSGHSETVNISLHGSQFLSKEQAEEYVFRYVRPIIERFGWKNLFLHQCKNPTLHLDTIANFPFKRIIIQVGFEADLGELKRRFGERMCFVGNVNPKLLLEGDPGEVAEASRRCIEKAAYGGGYVLGPGAEVWAGTPAENLDAMIRVAEKHGKYRINPFT